MAYRLKAEYEFRTVAAWHVVPDGESRGLCGAPLAPAAPTRPISDLEVARDACQACEALHASLRTQHSRAKASEGGTAG